MMGDNCQPMGELVILHLKVQKICVWFKVKKGEAKYEVLISGS